MPQVAFDPPPCCETDGADAATRARDHQARYIAGTSKHTSRATVSQVAGWLSPGPKQPHGADTPRTTADATAIVNSVSSVAATADETGSNKPAMR